MRKQALQKLVEVLSKDTNVAAAWEGGAAANGRVDPYSDIDLNILAATEDIPAIWTVIESALLELGPITHRWHVAEPLAKEMQQRFYFIGGAPEFFFFDIGIFKPGATDLFLEPERHGTAVVHIDHGNRIKPQPLDRNQFGERLRRRLENISQAFPVYRTIVLKELRRNHPIDAFGYYQACLRLLNEALGARFRPFTYDFGFRYQHLDMPAEVQEKVIQLAYVASPATLEAKLQELEALFNESIQGAQLQLVNNATCSS